MNTNNNVQKGQNGTAGQWHQNGFKVTESKKSTIHLYCMKCGKLKSEHKFLQGCPK